MMYFKALFTMVFVALSVLQMAHVRPVFANPVDDNIRLLEEIRDATRDHYQGYVHDYFTSEMKLYYLHAMSDYLGLAREWGRHQSEAAAQIESLGEIWRQSLEAFEDTEVSEFNAKVSEIVLIQHQIEDALTQLRAVRRDLRALIEFWPNRCDPSRVNWLFDRNQPLKSFVITSGSAVSLPQETVQFSVQIGGGGGLKSEGQGVASMVGFLTGAVVAQGIKTGVLSGIAAASSATPVGAAVSVAVTAVWSAVDSAIEAGKLSKQWKLVEEIRNKQIETVTETDTLGKRIIGEICEQFLLPGFVDRIRAADERNSELLDDGLRKSAQMNRQWEGLKTRHQELIRGLEETYFAGLEDRVLEMMTEVQTKRLRQTNASLLFVRDQVGPVLSSLRDRPADRPDWVQAFWSQLMIGDALFSSSRDDVWESMKIKMLGRVLR